MKVERIIGRDWEAVEKAIETAEEALKTLKMDAEEMATDSQDNEKKFSYLLENYQRADSTIKALAEIEGEVFEFKRDKAFALGLD